MLWDGLGWDGGGVGWGGVERDSTYGNGMGWDGKGYLSMEEGERCPLLARERCMRLAGVPVYSQDW